MPPRVERRFEKRRPRPTRRHCEPTGPREARPDDRLREAIQNLSAEAAWIASSQALLAMTVRMQPCNPHAIQ